MADDDLWQESPFTALRRHWQESAAKEAANPLADRPTHAFMMEHGRPMDTAPIGKAVWLIEDGSTGVHLGSASGTRSLDGTRLLWFIQDAGDLWPARPTKWFPRALSPSLHAAE